jgi:hypothetical protein
LAVPIGSVLLDAGPHAAVTIKAKSTGRLGLLVIESFLNLRDHFARAGGHWAVRFEP